MSPRDRRRRRWSKWPQNCRPPNESGYTKGIYARAGENTGSSRQDLFQAVKKDALSLDDLGPRFAERKPCRAVHFGHPNRLSAARRPFDLAGDALDMGGIDIAYRQGRIQDLEYADR